MSPEKDSSERLYEIEKEAALLIQRANDADKALAIALKDLERRLSEMNEFRSQINKERAEFVLKVWFDNKYEQLERKINIIDSWKSNTEGKFSGAWLVAGIIAAAISMATSIGIRLIFK
jgi:hypothetical protein